MAAFQKRQSERAKGRIERDADIRASVRTGVPLRELGRKYMITMERVRPVGKGQAISSKAATTQKT
jgi:hypothetical protein